MFKTFMFAIVLSAVTFTAACSSARRTGSTVKDATVAAGEEVGDKAEGLADKTEDVADVTADKTEDVAQAAADKTADATITSAIKMKFAADDDVKALAIDVDTSDGNVTLTGTVKTQAEADRAVMLAKGVEGVKNVTPKLTVSAQ